jgi:hypothetical protein
MFNGLAKSFKNFFLGVGFETTPKLVDQNALWQRINGASLET